MSCVVGLALVLVLTWSQPFKVLVLTLFCPGLVLVLSWSQTSQRLCLFVAFSLAKVSVLVVLTTILCWADWDHRLMGSLLSRDTLNQALWFKYKMIQNTITFSQHPSLLLLLCLLSLMNTMPAGGQHIDCWSSLKHTSNGSILNAPCLQLGNGKQKCLWLSYLYSLVHIYVDHCVCSSASLQSVFEISVFRLSKDKIPNPTVCSDSSYTDKVTNAPSYILWDPTSTSPFYVDPCVNVDVSVCKPPACHHTSLWPTTNWYDMYCCFFHSPKTHLRLQWLPSYHWVCTPSCGCWWTFCLLGLSTLLFVCSVCQLVACLPLFEPTGTCFSC